MIALTRRESQDCKAEGQSKTRAREEMAQPESHTMVEKMRTSE